ncbi:MAG: hypothetical protein IKJ04_02905 [Clostridia bacterium]|nr:hypothetical protein [Clostridia bacterium]
MKKIRLICLLLGILMLLSSCQSVYDVPLVPPETTANPNVDLSDEYYTTGVPYRTGDIKSGMLYEGCLIYIEKCTTTGIVGDKTDADGVKTPSYGDVTVERIVKYNPVTGTVSSPCLDPNCNHSLESGCPMLLGGKVNDGKSQVYVFQGIFGDWLVYLKFMTDDEYGSVMSEIMYNLKTGEVRENFSDDYGEKVVSKWRNGWYVDGKYYKVNSVMDYSKTGYTPGSGQKLSDFKPVTRQYVYEYDFDTDESKKLFEITDECFGFMATSERFYIERPDGTEYSIKKDGTDKREENRPAASNFVGTYSILSNTNGFSVYDLKTDETKEVIWEYSVLGNLCVTEKGVLSAHQTKYDEWDNFSVADYRKEHPNLTSEEINNEARKILASGTAQIWQCDYMGDNNHVIFELPSGNIKIISAYGDYVFATVSKIDPETGKHLEGYKSQPCCINITTGEITPIPQLDIVVPYWYEN